jgi:hypothetical protein
VKRRKDFRVEIGIPTRRTCRNDRSSIIQSPLWALEESLVDHEKTQLAHLCCSRLNPFPFCCRSRAESLETQWSSRSGSQIENALTLTFAHWQAWVKKTDAAQSQSQLTSDSVPSDQQPNNHDQVPPYQSEPSSGRVRRSESHPTPDPVPQYQSQPDSDFVPQYQ